METNSVKQSDHDGLSVLRLVPVTFFEATSPSTTTETYLHEFDYRSIKQLMNQ